MIHPPPARRHGSEWQIAATIALGQITLLPAAIATYPDHFSLSQDPLSALGAPYSATGLPNRASMGLFAANLILVGVMLLIQANLEWTSPRGRSERIKARLALLGAIGAFVALAPFDRFWGVHSIGTGMMIGSLWGLAMVATVEIWRAKPRAAVGVQLLLQGSVLPYALSFARDGAAKQLLQKPAILGLTLALFLATVAKDHLELAHRERLEETIRASGSRAETGERDYRRSESS